MDKKDIKERKSQEKTFYYVNPNTPSEPEAKVYCANSRCVNFIPVHQTCNLKTVLISAKGKCEFSVNKRITKLKAHAKQIKANQKQ
jgi:hypothetical protein